MKHLSTFESHNNDDIINRIGELDKKLNSREFEVKTKFSFTKFSFTKNEKRTFNLVKTKNYISNNKVRTEFPKCKPCPIFENN